MVRVVVLVIAVLYLSAATGFAQAMNELSTQPTAQSTTRSGAQSSSRLDVSAKAAGLDRIGSEQEERSSVKATSTPAKAPRASSRTKWIIAAVVIAAIAVVAIAAGGGYGNGDGSGYQ